jgi:hypothetical protein
MSFRLPARATPMNTHFKPARLSSRLSAVRPSPTIAITRLANELRGQGRDVIGLSQGEVSLIIR